MAGCRFPRHCRTWWGESIFNVCVRRRRPAAIAVGTYSGTALDGQPVVARIRADRRDRTAGWAARPRYPGIPLNGPHGHGAAQVAGARRLAGTRLVQGL